MPQKRKSQSSENHSLIYINRQNHMFAEDLSLVSTHSVVRYENTIWCVSIGKDKLAGGR